MDLLHHYCTSDEESSDHDDSQHNRQRRQEHQKDDRQNECKKKRRIIKCDMSGNCDTEAYTKAGIELLSSPKERIHLKQKNAFKRNRPHIQGNWSGNIYISLKPNVSSGMTATAVSFEERNADAYRRFKRLAYSTIMNFHNQISTLLKVGNKFACDKAAARDNIDGNNDRIIIVPHVNMNEVNKHSSDSSCTANKSSNIDSDSDGDECNSGDSSSYDDDYDDEEMCLHISLAKPFYLQKQSIQPFINDLKKRLSLVPIMSVQFDTNYNSCTEASSKWEILVNESKTRSFLTIPVCSSDHKSRCLKELISIIDPVMIKYGLECYYSSPKFHCSIASWKGHYDWMTGAGGRDNECENNERLARNIKKSDVHDSERILTFVIRGIYCDFGTLEKHFIEFNKPPF